MRVHLVHGIRTAVGCTTVAALRSFFEAAGARVFYPDYGYELGLETKIVNPFIVNTLCAYIEPGDIWVGHSNGCALGYEVMKAAAPLAGAVFINAALERDIIIPAQIKWLDVLSNEGDTVVEAAVAAEKLGLVDAHYGDMGRFGYRGTDPRAANIYCSTTAGLPQVFGHSDLFTEANLAAWAPAIIKMVMAHA